MTTTVAQMRAQLGRLPQSARVSLAITESLERPAKQFVNVIVEQGKTAIVLMSAPLDLTGLPSENETHPV